MRHTFSTIDDAIAAGYERPGRGDRDVSGTDGHGGQYFGYDFERDGRQTVDVWFTDEPNRGGGVGAALAMFPPNDHE